MQCHTQLGNARVQVGAAPVNLYVYNSLHSLCFKLMSCSQKIKFVIECWDAESIVKLWIKAPNTVCNQPCEHSAVFRRVEGCVARGPIKLGSLTI